MFQHICYHEADIFEFERQSAQHWMATLGYGERIPALLLIRRRPKVPPSSDAVESELQYISAKEIIEATGLSALNCPLGFVQRKGSTRLF
ncbi:MAG: hypothetical protein Q4A11_06505 [Brachymonas sp.]|nr:hypothetical protein [Brachymonas sp.]